MSGVQVRMDYIHLKWLENLVEIFPPQLQPAADWLPCQSEAMHAKLCFWGVVLSGSVVLLQPLG